jgi:ferritin-like metal-binding protein YciE
MEFDSIESLLEQQLKDLYSAEAQLLKALPKMARAASSPSLQDAFESHTEETRTHVERLQEIGQSLGFKLGGHKCKGMEGLIEEGAEFLEGDGEEAVIDAGLIASAQRIEHYEISGYGTARTLAEKCGESEVVDLLQQTLDEESATDEKLTQISEGELLPNAPMRSGQGEEEGEEASDFMAGRSSGRSGGGGSRRAQGSRTSRSSGSSSRSGSSSNRGTSRSGRAGGKSRSGGSRAGNSRGSGSRGGSKSRSSR